MARQSTAAGVEAKPTIITRIRDFYHDVMFEMGKVTWPSKEELKSSTSVVLFVLGVVAAIVYVYDIVFQFGVLGLFRLLGRG